MKLQAVFRHMSIECDRGCEGDEDDDDSDSDETTSSATSSEDFDNSEGDNSSWAPGEDFQTNSTEFSIFTEEKHSMWIFSILQKLFKKYNYKVLCLSTFSTFSTISMEFPSFGVTCVWNDDIISRAPSCHTVFLNAFGRYVQLSA